MTVSSWLLNNASGFVGGAAKLNEKSARAELSRLAAIANKRAERLERNDFTDSPVYQKYIEGQPRFSVRGKSYNELQQELSRLRNFLGSKTSTIRGMNQNLKDIASTVGLKYKNLTELREKSQQFFRLSDKVEEYLRSVHDMASAIGYQQIWEAINEYVAEQGIDLTDSENQIDLLTERVSEAIRANDSGSLLTDEDTLGDGWFIIR